MTVIHDARRLIGFFEVDFVDGHIFKEGFDNIPGNHNGARAVDDIALVESWPVIAWQVAHDPLESAPWQAGDAQPA